MYEIVLLAFNATVRPFIDFNTRSSPGHKGETRKAFDQPVWSINIYRVLPITRREFVK